MNKSPVPRTQRSTYFQILYYALDRWTRTPQSNIAWEDRLAWFESSPQHRPLDRIDGEPMEFEWNIFPGFATVQLCHKVQELLSRLSVTPEKFTWRVIFMSMFNDISWGSKDNKKECESNAQLVSPLAKRFGAGHWSFLGPGSEKKVVFYKWIQSTRRMGQNGREDDVDICRKPTPSIPIQSIVQRSA